jgi:hypothetical protein
MREVDDDTSTCTLAISRRYSHLSIPSSACGEG